MSIFKTSAFDIESFSLETNPKTIFLSNSSGITGAIYVYPRKSHSIRDEYPDGSSKFFEDSDKKELKITVNTNETTGSAVKKYFKSVSSKKTSNPLSFIKRLIPEYSGSFEYVSDVKQQVSSILMPYYRSSYDNPEMSYTNYHSINFISSSTTPHDVALVYLNPSVNPVLNSSYTVTDKFTFNFHINVRNKLQDVRPGTILHLSSNYVVSVVSGSSRDHNGLVDKYGIQLQLKENSYIVPSVASPDNDLTFRFDNILSANHWHDVTLTWSKDFNNSTGSIYVDGNEVGIFPLAYNNVKAFTSTTPCLIVGNFYEGPSGASMTNFFSPPMRSLYGVPVTGSSTQVYPFTYDTFFNHVGYFELHDINIKRTVTTGSGVSLPKRPTNFDDFDFYLSPTFTEFSEIRRPDPLSGKGGVLITTRQSISASTSTPFNIIASNNMGAHLMNLENHLRESRNRFQPFLLNLSASINTNPSTTLKINDYFYSYDSVRAMNSFILPCDDGKFEFANSKVSLKDYVDFNSSIGVDDDFLKSLWSIVYSKPLKFHEEKILEKLGLLGPTPKYPLNPQLNDSFPNKLKQFIDFGRSISLEDRKYPAALAYKFYDFDSMQVVFFDISNLYYGNTILPGTFVLTDNALTGTSGQVSLTIRDNGFGGLYRADSETTHAIFNNVGNIFYNEGIVMLKNPSLYFLGKDAYEIKFKGKRNVHVMNAEVIAPRNTLNSSSNPTYIENLKPSKDQIDDDENFVYISGVNFHDDNFNVVARMKLAQPIIKREFSKIAFRMKLDF